MGILASTMAIAQSTPEPPESAFPVSTNRPSYSDTSTLVPFGHPQIEGGVTYTRVGGVNLTTYGELMYRQRIGAALELRVSNGTYGVYSGDGTGKDWQDPSLGFSYRLQTSGAHRPEVSLLGYVTLPTGGNTFRTEAYQPTVKLAATYALDARTALGGNLIVSALGATGSRFNQTAASLFLTYAFNAKLGSYYEVYHVAPLADQGPHGSFADAGLTYLLNPRTQLDVRVGTGFDQSRDGWFIGAGFAYRF